MDLVRANAFERTYEIATDLGRGTAFTVDVGEAQYLVTARHLLPEGNVNPAAEIANRFGVTATQLSLLDVQPANADVAVALLEEPLTTGFLPLPASIDGLAWSQQVFFLGYPHGLATQLRSGDPGDRIAFVKSGIWSATATVDGVDLIYIDGHNNPGFSGGPVVGFKPGADEAQVFGVVSGYRLEHQPLYVGTTEISEITAAVNSGIVIATSIVHVMHAINSLNEPQG